MMVVAPVMVFGRTGRMIILSTAWFAVISAAALAENDATGDVDRQAGQWHRLAKIGEVIRYARSAFGHRFPPTMLNESIPVSSPTGLVTKIHGKCGVTRDGEHRHQAVQGRRS